jgi:excisionase family DNA binding protein
LAEVALATSVVHIGSSFSSYHPSDRQGRWWRTNRQTSIRDDRVDERSSDLPTSGWNVSSRTRVIRWVGIDLVTPVSGAAESYRKADLRIRQLLLGDGSATTGLVKGEEFRLRVTADLRRMRDAFNVVVLESEGGRAETEESRAADLETELVRIASFRSRVQQMWPDADVPALMTPAEAAEAVRMSVGTIYRAVRNGQIRAVRLTDRRRGALRIPTSELRKLLDGTRH